jgi:cysteine desulfurase
MVGGGQELKRRGGTENLPGIAGFGAAAKAACADVERFAGLAELRDALEEQVRESVDEVRIFSADAPRLANTSCFAVPGVTAELALIALDLNGVAVSTGSACSSGKVSRSHVLAAMGVDDDLAECALRVSFGWASEASDVARFGAAWKEIVKQHARTSAAA